MRGVSRDEVLVIRDLGERSVFRIYSFLKGLRFICERN